MFAAPLFEEHTPLEVRLAGPLNEVIRDRSEEPEEQDMVFTLPDGRPLDVEVRQRGNFRRQRRICRFPPLRLDFDKDQVGDTVLAGQNKLKLVTHCRDRDEYQQNVFKEYLAYRVLNLLTEASFRVRMLHIEYADTDGKHDMTRYGFVIEDVDALAERLDGEHVEPEGIPRDALVQPAATLVSVFQYFIGNLDYSLIAAYADEPCCHNVKLVRMKNGAHLPVPYDFDMAGIVDASYAYPPGQLAQEHRLRSVRDRLYRGFCAQPGMLQAAIGTFVEKREAIYALIDVHGLMDERETRDTRRFFDDFYEDIEDESRIERAFECR